MMNRRIGKLGCLALLFICVGDVRGDYVLSLTPDASSQSINVNVGDLFNINLYLIETNTSTLTDSGLLSFGTRGVFSSSLIAATGGTIDPSFPFVGGGPNPDISTAGQVDVFGAAATAPKGSVIHLATLTFTAMNSGSTIIRFGDLDPLFDDFSLNDNNVTSLDTTLFGAGLTQTFDFSVNVNVVAVPETNFGILLLVTGSTIVSWRRYRRRKIPLSRT